ncbi:hypothetical protein N9B71_04875 [Pirellulales bacterium]|nr:hypothetical protein [Pirellulales bacterium]
MFPSQPKPFKSHCWGEISRALATLVLVIYFIGLGLSVACNTESGSSLLLGVVKEKLFSFWKVSPWLDLGFDHFFTYGQQTDATHYLELRMHGDAGWITMSRPSVRTGESIRWQRLLHSAIASEEDLTREGILPAGFSEAAFAVCESDDIDLRILVLPRPERQAPINAPAPIVLYQARIRRIDDNDIQLIKSESRREMAPVVSQEGGAE